MSDENSEVENEDFSDYEKATGDIEAYWDSASPPDIKDWREDKSAPPKHEGSGPVHFEPLYMSMSDSKIKPAKGQPWQHSTLIHGKLLSKCVLRPATGKNESQQPPREFAAGTHIGIWAKPGMRPLLKMAGSRVLMENAGFKDVGQPSLMVDYDIRSKGNGTKLGVPHGEDRRDKSLPEELREARKQSGELDAVSF